MQKDNGIFKHKIPENNRGEASNVIKLTKHFQIGTMRKESYREETYNANQGLNKSAARAAAIRAKIWRRRPERERTIEAD